MSISAAVFQGIIQGLTEFLPVSSSGHLSLYQHFTGNSGDGALFMSAILHLGTLTAVIIAFRATIGNMLIETFRIIKLIFTGKFRMRELSSDGRAAVMMVVSSAVLIPFFIFRDFFESVSQDGDIIVEGICFIYTAVLLFLSDKCTDNRKRFGDIKLWDAVKVGAFQGAALLPGVSRSGSTIAGGLFCGFERKTAVEYSFILGIPAIAGGCFTEGKRAAEAGIEWDLVCLGAGFLTALAVGILAIRLVKILAATDRMRVFSVYTFIVGITAIAVGITEKTAGRSFFDIIKNMF